MRVELADEEHYHVFNRGVDKRTIFADAHDIDRFLTSLRMFNSTEPIGSIYEHRFNEKQSGESIVDVIAYCLNVTHYHLILRQTTGRGIQRFMQRLATGYTMYFNEKYKRTGALFQGRYKAVHISSNEQLLHTSVYVNLNNQLGGSTSKLGASSWGEYRGSDNGFCKKDIVLEQFATVQQYELFAKMSAAEIAERKRAEKEMQWLGG